MKAIRSFFQLHSWTILFSMIALEGFWVLWLFIRVPSETKNNLIWGFSPQRLVSILITLILVFFWAGLAYLSWKKFGWLGKLTERLLDQTLQKKYSAALTTLVFVGLLLSTLPVDRQQLSGSAYDRFRPLIQWLTLAAGEILAFCFITWKDSWFADYLSEKRSQKKLLAAAGAALAIFALTWLMILATGTGITPDDRYWNEAGVPLLGFQILLTLAFSLATGAVFFVQTPGKLAIFSGWKLDLFICLILWASAAFFWSQTPMPRSYFAPGPYSPNQVFYPFSDAEVYDRGAQYIFIGQGLNNHEYVDKPFYILMLAFFHLIAGKDYLPVVQLQAICLAGLPALLYLMGKSLHSRSAGLLAGLFLVCQQTNAIAATLQIQVSHSRLMMAEFPTAFGMALLALVIIRWLKQPAAASLWVLGGGGILGILLLIRTNPIFLLPIIIVLFMVVFGRQWQKWLLSSLLFLCGVMLVIGPWFFLNRTPEGSIFFEEKFKAVFDQRYDESKPPNPAFDLNGKPIATAVPTSIVTAAVPTPIVATVALTPTTSATIPAPTAQPTSPPAAAADPLSQLGGRIYKALQFVPDHFIHNLVTAVLILPTSAEYDSFSFLDLDLRAPYWKITWNGSLPLGNALFLLAMLGILALGIGSAWHSSRLAGLVPLIFLAVYYLANAFARTSGSRYLVPADWVVLFYFALGLIQSCRWLSITLRNPLERPVEYHPPLPQSRLKRAVWLRSLILLAVVLLLTGSSMNWIGRFFPVRYPPTPPADLLQTALARGSLQKAGLSQAELTAFLKQPDAIVLRGKGLYPRFYDRFGGETSSIHTSFSPTDYSRLIIRLIGPITTWVLLPTLVSPETFPDDRDITVVGCVKGLDVMAKVIMVESSPDQVYLRTPQLAWTCP